jgi:voltage-gated potassium channel
MFGGGIVYNQLLIVAGYEPLPLITLPYFMIGLMLFQGQASPPPEAYLMVFWYTMPLITAYIVGRGAIDFVRLFFNRSERRNAWEEAVASTYRNHVIILGIGHLGLRVTRSLMQMGFEVVAIDNHIELEHDEELGRLGVPVINGDGRHSVTLEAAGLRDAQAFIVCSSQDYMNLEVTMRARDLNPNIRIVVRMWDNQFASQIRQFMNVEAVMSATDLAAPAFAGTAVGIEIAQTLHVKGAEYSMIRMRVNSGSFIDGKTIIAVEQDYGTDIVLYEHGDNVQIHPNGNTTLHAGDTIVIFALHSSITDLVARNRRC